ncbi:hypothetical protein [Aquimarina algiphila]|uniref:hypothetical protein n=1 Tax=Aquimarina algiphila TaxID=2047982 RepID=UPI0024927C97|nr:hypothetical protein [Aquimarina algiphila]
MKNKFLLIIAVLMLITFQSCNDEENNELDETLVVDTSEFFILKDGNREITPSIPKDLIKLVAKDVKKLKGVESYRAFLNTYDLETGLLKISKEKAEELSLNSSNVSKMSREPFNVNFSWSYQRWRNAAKGFFSTDFKSQYFDPNSASTSVISHNKERYRNARQALWGFSFGVVDADNGSDEISNYPVRLRAFSDIGQWSNWITLTRDRTTGLSAWVQGKHAEAFQIEMITNSDDGSKLFDLLYYTVHRGGSWQPWVSSPNVAGTPGGDKLQGAAIAAYFF